jgi:hypothetical protein
MALTGRPDGPPLAPAAPVLYRLHSVARSIADLSEGLGRRVDLDVPALLTARAAESNLTRRGSVSANGSCHLLAAGTASPRAGGAPADRQMWWALNLARPDDVSAVPAALAGLGGITVNDPDPWPVLEAAGDLAGADELVSRCRQLGMPAASLGNPPLSEVTEAPWRRHPMVAPARQRRPGAARVVDLSALWAGPLCGHLLSEAGFAVTKVESGDRPDALRSGNPGLFARLHARQELLTVDLGTAAGRHELRERLEDTDVVIEGSRGRALDQLGLGPADVRHRPGSVWLTITGYGRTSPWVAFGDDAAVAGGLVAWDHAGPVFAGDAIADPITGLLGALAVLKSLAAGGGQLLDLAMRDAVDAVAAGPSAAARADHAHCEPERMAGGRWRVRCRRDGAEAPVRTPAEVGGP